MFHFNLLTITDARELLSWRYEEPYTLYNIVAQPGKQDELLAFFVHCDLPICFDCGL